MSLEYLRSACIKAFEEAATQHSNAAINMTPQTGLTSDQYAMMQVDRLAQARALMQAAQIVTAEYKRLTEPQKVHDENVEQLKPRKNVY